MMDLSYGEKITIENEGFKAMQEYIASCTVVITSKDERFEHGSGVAVRFNNQCYILTAAHVLNQDRANNDLLLIGSPGVPFVDVQESQLTEAILKFAVATKVTIENTIFGKNREDIADVVFGVSLS